MKCFPYFVIFFYFLVVNLPCRAQFKDRPSEIKTKITIPIFVDFTEKTDWTNPKYEDTEKRGADRLVDIYIDLPHVPLETGSDVEGYYKFSGEYTDDLMPFPKYKVKGRVYGHLSMVEQMIITKNVEYDKDGYQETEKWKVTIRELPLNGGIGRFTKGKTSVSVDEYEYKSVYNAGSRMEYKDYTFKSMDKEKTFDAWNFSVYLNIGGSTSYTMKVEDVRGPDAAWEPPAARANPDYYVHDIEPNSLGFYTNSEGLDKDSKTWTKFYAEEIMFLRDFAKPTGDGHTSDLNIPGLQVLERGKNGKILAEIDLSQSGLVKEESKVNAGKLMKEQVAIITRVDTQQNTFECDIQSRKGEKRIIATGITSQNRDIIFATMKTKVYQAINGFTSKPLIPVK